MAFQSVPFGAEFRLIYTRGGDFFLVNTINVSNPVTAWNLAHLLATEGKIFVWWNTNVKPLITVAYSLVEIQFRDLTVMNGLAGSVPHAVPGTRAGIDNVGILSARVKLVGEAGEEPPRGAVYQPPGAEADIDSSTWSVGFAGAVEDAWTALNPAVSAGLFPEDLWTIVSRFDGTALVNKPNGEVRREPVKRPFALSNVITDVQVRTRVSPQKRRRPRPPSYIT